MSLQKIADTERSRSKKQFCSNLFIKKRKTIAKTKNLQPKNNLLNLKT